jgi:hypothetical protein
LNFKVAYRCGSNNGWRIVFRKNRYASMLGGGAMKRTHEGEKFYNDQHKKV